jgi:adenosine kinase
MDFSGRYSEHFVAGRLDNINVSLMVNGLTENLGGTAGNIAYALSLLGEKPRILAAIGKDHQRYFEWLDQHGISTQDIRIGGMDRVRLHHHRPGRQPDNDI